jgi:hypothetical protein
MRRMAWTRYLWPGLPQLWGEGAWSGLALAAGSAVLLNLLLLSTFVWFELLGESLLTFGWLAAASVWLVSGVLACWSDRQRRDRQKAHSTEDLFRQALGEYLKGNWFEAETILGRLLRHDPRDLEARLMLASLLRHTRRLPEARQQLLRLERLEGAEKWRTEIGAELDLLTELQSPPGVNEETIDPASHEISQAA